MEPSNKLRVSAPVVLVVDDEVAIRELLGRFLEDRGFSVKNAGTVADAKLALADGPIDAVVLDVRISDRPGLELLEFIRQQPKLRDIPVLVFTGASLTPDEEAIIARANGYVFYKSESPRILATYLERLAG